MALRHVPAAVVAALALGVAPAGAVQLPRGPIWHTTAAIRHVWSCVLWHESRSTFAHINLGDDNGSGGPSGIFQIKAKLWDRWAPKLGIHVPVWRATPAQQELVAYEIETCDGGWWAWSTDGCFA